MKSCADIVFLDLQERSLLAATSVTCVSSRSTTWRDTKGHTVARNHIAAIPANKYATCSLEIAIFKNVNCAFSVQMTFYCSSVVDSPLRSA